MPPIRSKRVTIRKPCYCWGCGRPYKVGETVVKVTWCGDGGFRTIPWCEICLQWWRDEATALDDDGIAEGVLRSDYSDLYPDGDETWRGGPTVRRGVSDGDTVRTS